MTTSGWQAEISHTDGTPVQDPDEATEAVRRFVPDAGRVEIEDAHFGIYLIDLSDMQRAELLDDGWLHLADSDFEINVEMP